MHKVLLEYQRGATPLPDSLTNVTPPPGNGDFSVFSGFD
jgi:hypothetical protein